MLSLWQDGLVAGLAASGAMLIIGRTLQRVGGGAMVIMVTVVVADLFPLKERAMYYTFSSIVLGNCKYAGTSPCVLTSDHFVHTILLTNYDTNCYASTLTTRTFDS